MVGPAAECRAVRPVRLSTLDRPRALLADPGLPLDFDAAPLWQQVLGQPLQLRFAGGLSGLALRSPGGPVPWALLLALLIGAAGAACWPWPRCSFPPRRARVARALWVGCARCAGRRLAGRARRHRRQLPQALVTPFTGPAVSAAVFALLGAALIGGESLLDLADATPTRGAAVPSRGRAGAPS